MGSAQSSELDRCFLYPEIWQDRLRKLHRPHPRQSRKALLQGLSGSIGRTSKLVSYHSTVDRSVQRSNTWLYVGRELHRRRSTGNGGKISPTPIVFYWPRQGIPPSFLVIQSIDLLLRQLAVNRPEVASPPVPQTMVKAFSNARQNPFGRAKRPLSFIVAQKIGLFSVSDSCKTGPGSCIAARFQGKG